MVRTMQDAESDHRRSCQWENVGKVKICKLNVDNAQRISKRYGVMSIPTVMLFKDGEEVERAIGFDQNPISSGSSISDPHHIAQRIF